MRATHSLLALSFSLLALVPGRALANGLAAPTVGPSNMGVSTQDAASVFHNPAGLGFAEGKRLLLGGSLVIGDVRIKRNRLATYQYEDSLDFALPIEQSAIDADKTGPADEVRTHPVALAPSIFGQFPIGDLPVVAGFGVYVPYAARVNFPDGGAQRWQVIDAFIAATHFTPSLAWRAHERFSIGAGVSYVLGIANLTRVQDFAALQDMGDALAGPPINQPNDFGPDADPGVRELDTMARPFSFRRGWANSATFNVGVTAEPTNGLFIGASYTHSTKMKFKGDFKLDMNDPFFTQDLASQGLLYPPMVTGGATMRFTLPAVARFGVRYDFGWLGSRPQSSIAFEGAYTGWSSVKNFDVRVKSPALAQPELGLPDNSRIVLPRNWRDTYMGQVRATHRLTSSFGGWVSFGVESSAVPDSTIDAASPDGVRILSSGGLELEPVHDVRILMELNVQGTLKREVDSSDYDLGNGTYKLRLYTLSAYLDFGF